MCLLSKMIHTEIFLCGACASIQPGAELPPANVHGLTLQPGGIACCTKRLQLADFDSAAPVLFYYKMR